MKRKREKTGLTAVFLCLLLAVGGCGAPADHPGSGGRVGSKAGDGGETASSAAGSEKIVISAPDVDAFSLTIQENTLRGGMPVSELEDAGYLFMEPDKSDVLEAGETRDALLMCAMMPLSATVLNDTGSPQTVNDCILSGFVLESPDIMALPYGMSVEYLKYEKPLSDFGWLYELPPQEDIQTDGDRTVYTYRGSAQTGSRLILSFDDALDRIEYVYKKP